MTVEEWLKQYDTEQARLKDIKIQLADAEERYDPESIPAVDPSRDYVKAGEVKSEVETKVIKYVDKVRELEASKADVENYLQRVENVLKVLNPDERDIVERCIMSSGTYKDTLFSKSRFYKIRENALAKISKIVYPEKVRTNAGQKREKERTFTGLKGVDNKVNIC